MDLISLSGFTVENKLLFVLLILWTMVWKGLVLWKAGRKNDRVWFIVLFLVSTAGILDIIYYYHISKRKMKHKITDSQ